MYNPFKEIATGESDDRELVSRSLSGDKNALESLVTRHQAWVYNIALRMVFDPYEAEDVTQEVLLKVITRLSTYDPGKAAFRTWLYRIAANHVINAKKSAAEILMSRTMKERDFERFSDSIPDRRRSFDPGRELLREETKISCVLCILLCLDRRERLVFILGSVFSVNDRVGAEIAGVSRANFRKILSRARERLYRFFSGNCGLLNPANPCRCEDKAAPMIRNRLMDPENPLAGRDSLGTVREAVSSTVDTIEDSYYEFHSLFRDQPFLRAPDMVRWLREFLERDDLRGLFPDDRPRQHLHS